MLKYQLVKGLFIIRGRGHLEFGGFKVNAINLYCTYDVILP